MGNDKLLFLHVPKAGGTWAMEAMLAAGVDIIPERKGEGAQHLRLRQCAPRGRFVFGFVREPLSWYFSTYRYRRKARWEDDGFPGDKWLDLKFPEFLGRMIKEFPSWVSFLYEDFLGPPNDTVDFVGHFENLADDLVQVLNTVGQDFDEEVLRAFPPQNTSDPAPLTCPDDLRRELIFSESTAYHRFYPSILEELALK